MIVSAGQLHSSARLLELISSTMAGAVDFALANPVVLVCPVEEVINLCTRCGWVEIDAAGNLRPSMRGDALRALSDYQERLRLQLRDVVTTLQPAWGKVLMHGRREVARFAPPDVSQCFKEAGLMSGEITDAIVQWWDELGGLARGFRSAGAMAVGRKGERLTLAYETQRTGSEAIWQSIETSFSGYDVLSVVSDVDATPMQVEVKASELRLKDAFAHISANEWESAQSARAHQFHLWHVGSPPQLAVVDVGQMSGHIPSDQGDGRWESVRVPYRAFIGHFKRVDASG